MAADREKNAACLEQIEAVCREQIRPMLLRHGGGISVEEFDPVSGLLRVRLLGSCSGCPAARLTTGEEIRRVLTGQIPEVREVVLEEPVSSELLRQAEEILSRGRRKNEEGSK